MNELISTLNKGKLIKFLFYLSAFFLFFAEFSYATDVYLDVESSEVRKISIALPFFNISQKDPELLRLRIEALKILSFDLREAGLFQLIDVASHSDEINNLYLRQKTLPFSAWYFNGVQAVIVGKLAKEGDTLVLDGALFDIKLQMMMTGKKYKGKSHLFRQMIHKFSDEIIYRFTGEKGISHSKIVFVQERNRAKELVIMDYDGANKQFFTRNKSINISPEWDPDSRFIYFTSYLENNPAIYRLSVNSRHLLKVSSFKGINSAPAVSPDNTKLALTLSKDGNSEIYLMNLVGKKLIRLTFYKGIDTSPCWSPTGREIVFTSDRAGTPQLYIMDSEGLNLRRLTFKGTYNDSADWSPQGYVIAFVSRIKGEFKIFTVNVDGSHLKQITYQRGDNENPSWSYDGNFIVYSLSNSKTSNIFVIDKFGHNRRQLTFHSGKCSAPDWSH